jgi:hypothetical protein
VSTSASYPLRLSESARWLDESESPMKPVSGDLVSTANFAVVVTAVPTRGLETNSSGASGDSGATPGGQYR